MPLVRGSKRQSTTRRPSTPPTTPVTPHTSDSQRTDGAPWNKHPENPQAAEATVNKGHISPTEGEPLIGWEAVAKAMRDYDLEEIGALREDLDILLIFVGLFSAVVTAFVALSYTLLQENPGVQTMVAIRQLVDQVAGFVIVDGALVKTEPQLLPPITVFQPSPAAIRVNVLWFSSLIVSLSTASLSIFVNQWLRAYMAFSTSSARGQLRVRQFRHSGMKTWKVFGIVATLPLLLQLSVALFFAGLCYFTAIVHESVANATLILVIGWGSLIFAVTTFPAFSALCPYKTLALEVITTTLRTRMWPMIYISIRVVVAAPLHALSSLKRLLHALYAVLFLTPLLRAINTCRKIIVNRSRSVQNSAVTKSIVQLAKISYAGFEERFHNIDTLPDWVPQEESVVMHLEKDDLDILVYADALQTNEHFFATAMVAALEQSNPNWEGVVGFLVKVIGNRVPVKPVFPGSPSLIDCRALSIRAKEVITNLAFRHLAPLGTQVGSSVVERPLASSLSMADWAACLVISLWNPAESWHSEFLAKFLSADRDAAVRIAQICSRFGDSGATTMFLSSLCRATREAGDKNLEAVVPRLDDVLNVYFKELHIPTASSDISPFLRQMWQTSGWPTGLNQDSLKDTIGLLFELIHNATAQDPPIQTSPSFVSALMLVHRLCAISDQTARKFFVSLSWKKQLAQTAQDISSMKSVEHLAAFLEAWMHQPLGFVDSSDDHPVAEGLQSLTQCVKDLKTLELGVQRIASNQLPRTDFSRSKVVNLCLLIARVARRHSDSSPPVLLMWRSIFRTLAKTFKGLWANTGILALPASASNLHMLRRCMLSVAEADNFGKAPGYQQWTRHFRPEESPVPEYFWLIMMDITNDGATGSASIPWRVQRLRGMSESERLVLREEDDHLPSIAQDPAISNAPEIPTRELPWARPASTSSIGSHGQEPVGSGGPTRPHRDRVRFTRTDTTSNSNVDSDADVTHSTSSPLVASPLSITADDFLHDEANSSPQRGHRRLYSRSASTPDTGERTGSRGRGRGGMMQKVGPGASRLGRSSTHTRMEENETGWARRPS